MHINDISEGMKIRIGSNIDCTDKRFTTTPSMRNLKGHVCIVDSVNHARNRVIIDGCVWDAKDLSPVETLKIKRIKPVIFDPSHLDI
jgi:hypothetical protein